MPLTKLDHFLVQTHDIAMTRDWYAKVLGMHAGETPDFKFPVVWMYIGDQDVVHITEGGKDISENRKIYLGQQSTETFGSGAVDHIAFRATGLTDTIRHLTDIGVDFKQRQVADQGLYQLFMLDPNGIKVELNFESSEAEGIDAEVMASNLPDGS